MPRLEVLVEEPSAEAALRHLLPKLVPAAVRWKIFRHTTQIAGRNGHHDAFYALLQERVRTLSR